MLASMLLSASGDAEGNYAFPLAQVSLVSSLTEAVLAQTIFLDT